MSPIAAQKAGRGAVASANVTTVANPWFGIEAGFKVWLTVVYLSRATEWEKDLPEAVRKVGRCQQQQS